MKNKNIFVVYKGDDWNMKTPIKQAATRRAFQDFHDRGLKKNIHAYRANIDWYDFKKNVFKKSWAYRCGRWQKIKKPIRPDLIFDKISGKHNYKLFDYKMEISKKVRLFNHPLFRLILDNKFTQYVFMREFMVPSYLATNKDEIAENLKKIKSSRAVIKPLHGSGGTGIIIENKKKINTNDVECPVLVQEFVRSEKGIPGFSKKKEVSDLRMIYLNGRFIYALSRVARRGSLFTNFHKGASVAAVKKSKIPASAWKMAGGITLKLKDFGSTNYSLDFIFTNKGRPVLVEMNTTPGFDLLEIVGDEKIKDAHMEEFVKILNS